MSVRSRAVLSVGSNVGESRDFLRSVVAGFGEEVVAVSQVYATAPWGGVDQADFLNVTMIVQGQREPIDWLHRGAELEQAAQRTREVRWGPRTLDVDVITVEMSSDRESVGDTTHTVISADPTLTLPHPRASQRAFVLIPWCEIDPDATLWTPAGVVRVADVIAGLPESDRAGVRRCGTLSEARP